MSADGSGRAVRAARAPSLRRRVAAGVAAVVVAGLAVAGVTGVVALRAYLLDRTDTQLEAARETIAGAVAARPDAVVREGMLRRTVQGGLGAAAVHLLADGETVAVVASGGVPTPELRPADIDRLAAGPGWVRTEGATVRAVAVPTPGLQVELADGTLEPVDTVVVARDVSDDRATVRRLVLVELVTGAAVAAAALALTWWVVGRGMAPLRRMADAAEAVAAGDGSVRMPSTGPAETRALAGAVDAALDARARAEARLRDVVADTAHELRTPLTSVHGWAELYQQGALDEAGVDQAMDRIEAAATRMRHLVDQVALLARLDAEVPLERAPVELGAVVDEVLVDLDVIAPGRPVTWERPDAAVTVQGDRARLVQVVANLVANVVRHTPTEAALTVTVARVRRPGSDGGSAAVLAVHDAGPGVPPELAPRVFERFVRQTRTAGVTASGVREGSGLGLAIVAAIVEAHGGSVDLRSVPGEGTTVTVELPAIGV